MIVPLAAEPGTTSALAVPGVSTSYVWRGGPSSAQYYVNNAGVEHSSASSFLLPPSLLPPSSFLLPPSSFLLPPSSFLLPPSSFLLPPSFGFRIFFQLQPRDMRSTSRLSTSAEPAPAGWYRVRRVQSPTTRARTRELGDLHLGFTFSYPAN
jgi:hypothetical protein